MLLINNGQFVQLKCTNLSGSLGSYPDSGFQSSQELTEAFTNSRKLSETLRKETKSKVAPNHRLIVLIAALMHFRTARNRSN